MKTKIFLFSFLAFWLFTAGSCNDDDLPSATKTGENTFGCKVDGIVFTPTQTKPPYTMPQKNPLKVFGFYVGTENESQGIDASRKSDIKNTQYVYIFIYQIKKNKKNIYTIGKAPDYDTEDYLRGISYIKCRAISRKTGDYKIFGTTENSGDLEITSYANDGKKISGNFSGILTDLEGSGETIEITNGRFDINRETLN